PKESRHASGSRYHGAGSDDQRPSQISGRLGAHMFDAPSPIRAKIIIAKAVPLRINDSLQRGLQRHPLGGLDLNLKDGELHALAIIATGLGDPAQTTSAAFI